MPGDQPQVSNLLPYRSGHSSKIGSPPEIRTQT